MKTTPYNMAMIRAYSNFRREIGLILEARVQFSAEHQMEHVRRAAALCQEEWEAAFAFDGYLLEPEPSDLLEPADAAP